MTTSVSAVVFDFAGVLFGWQPAALLKQVLPAHATDDASAALWAERIFQRYEGDWAEFDRGVLGVAEIAERIAARTGLALPSARAVVDAVPGAMQPMAGTVALLHRLHAAGVPLFYLSNMPAAYALQLEAHGFIGCFGDGVISARVRAVKPERAIFDLAAARFGVPPGDLLFFDDVQANVDAACAAGWQALLFTGAEDAQAALAERGLLSGPAAAPSKRAPPAPA